MDKAFSNTVVDVDSLPQVSEVTFESLDPKYKWISFISTFIFLTVVLCGYIIIGYIFNDTLISSPWIYIIIFLYVSILIWWFWIEYKSFAMMGYALREHDVLIREGIFFKSLIAVPYNRIQHCETFQGVLSRLVGLSSISIHTAGGSGSEISIDGLSQEKAQQVRQFIISKASHAR
jgi:membrane protein YdbS with pleckstrin-like domain